MKTLDLLHNFFALCKPDEEFDNNPKQPRVQLSVSSPQNPILRVPKLAMMDSGCSMSSMSKAFYDNLVNVQKLHLPKRPAPFAGITSATNQRQQSEGIVELQLHFEGKNKVTTWINLKFLIIPQLAEDLLIGFDMMGSEFVQSLQPRQLTLKCRNPSKTKIALCKIPLQITHIKAAPCYTSQLTVIPPQSSCAIKGYMDRSKPHPSGMFYAENCLIEGMDILPLVYVADIDKNDQCVVTVPVFNISVDDLIIEANTPIFTATFLLPDGTSYSPADTYLPNMRVATYQSFPDYIDKDPYMNQVEKDQMKHQINTAGYAQTSMTDFVERHTGLSEFELQDIPKKPISEDDFLAQFKLDHLAPKHQSMAKKIFLKHRGAFSKHAYEIGECNLLEAEIKLKTDSPMLQKYHPIPMNVRHQVREILEQLLEYCIIRECTEPSPFCSNLLVVKKKDGKSIRLLLDARLLNHATIRMPSAVVGRHEILAHLVGKKIVSTVDISDAFYHVRLKRSSQALTSFYSDTHCKRFCFNRLVQGAKNSPAALTQVLQTVLAGLEEYCISYADDIIIASSLTIEHHLSIIEEVLRRLRKAGLKLRPPKLVIATPSVEILGLCWNPGKISIPESKLSAFLNLPSPRTPRQLKSMICTLSFYRTFVPKFAEMSKPLMDLTVLRPQQFKWTDESELQFRTLVNATVKNNSIHLPDPDLPFCAQSDASDIAGAGKLFQIDPITGEERILTCLSRTFTKAERNYSTIKKETLALLYLLRSNAYWVEHAKNLTIYTDAKSILFLRLAKESSGILLRFSLELSKYDATIIHVKGVDNQVCDTLSRFHKHADAMAILDKSNPPPLTEKETIQILQRLTLPDGLKFTPEEVKALLEGPSPPSAIIKKAKASAAKVGPRQVKLVPTGMATRKVKLPKTTTSRPGAILPKTRKKRVQNLPVNLTPLDHSDDLSSLSSLPSTRSNRSNESESSSDEEPTQTVNSPNRSFDDLHRPNIDQNEPDPETVGYSQITTLNFVIKGGLMTIAQYLKAQLEDPFCISIKSKNPLPNGFQIHKGILFRKVKDVEKPVLPEILLKPLVNTKHFSVYGPHSTSARIRREINQTFYIRQKVLLNAIQTLLKNCYVCQAYNMRHERQNVNPSNFAQASRQTWAIDLIPSLNQTKAGFKMVMIAVDYFTGYLQAVPLTDAKSKTLIDAIKHNIILPFGKPQVLRSDQQISMAHSKQFTDFLTEYNIQLLSTASASPASNGLAESGVKAFKHTLRKLSHQEGMLNEWDMLLPHLVAAHNSSTSVYGHSPEELFFGSRIPQANELLNFWPNNPTVDKYLDYIVPKVAANRAEMRRKAAEHAARNCSHHNRKRSQKTFEVGTQVLHKQMQLATGTGSSLHPRFNGVFTVESLNPDKVTAMIKNLSTGTVIKAHFDNMHPLQWSPDQARMSNQSMTRVSSITPQSLVDIPSTEELMSEIEHETDHDDSPDESEDDEPPSNNGDSSDDDRPPSDNDGMPPPGDNQSSDDDSDDNGDDGLAPSVPESSDSDTEPTSTAAQTPEDCSSRMSQPQGQGSTSTQPKKNLKWNKAEFQRFSRTDPVTQFRNRTTFIRSLNGTNPIRRTPYDQLIYGDLDVDTPPRRRHAAGSRSASPAQLDSSSINGDSGFPITQEFVPSDFSVQPSTDAVEPILFEDHHFEAPVSEPQPSTSTTTGSTRSKKLLKPQSQPSEPRSRVIMPSILRHTQPPPSNGPVPTAHEDLDHLTERNTSSNTRERQVHRMVLRSIRQQPRCSCCDQYEEDCSHKKKHRRK